MPALSFALRHRSSGSISARPKCTRQCGWGDGNWPGLHSEKLLDEWLVVVCHPALLAKLGAGERPGRSEALSLAAQLYGAVEQLAAGNATGGGNAAV